MKKKYPWIKHLQEYSVHTWKRIGFSWLHSGLRLDEDTLTQDLIFWIYEQAVNTNRPFELWQSNAEATNGDDIEIAIETPKGYELFPCQAKKINRSHKYPKISYSPNQIPQIHRLIDFANINGGIAIYLFYNCCFDREFLWEHYHGNFKNASSLGCSIVPAAYLNDHFFQREDSSSFGWRIPSFQDLHPVVGIPLHQFVDVLLEGKLFGNQAWNYYYQGTEKKSFSYDDLYDENLWDNLTPPPRISGIPKEVEHTITEDINYDYEFRPRFRIIVRQKKQLATIYRHY